jgi:hypothetical protein
MVTAAATAIGAKVKVFLDRGTRGMVELTAENRGRVVEPPLGSNVNADDVIELVWDKAEKDDEAKGIKRGDRVGEPWMTAILSRKWERRSFVRCGPKTATGTVEDAAAELVKECARRGWPAKQIEGGFVAISHPKGTQVHAASGAIGITLTEASLELDAER